MGFEHQQREQGGKAEPGFMAAIGPDFKTGFDRYLSRLQPLCAQLLAGPPSVLQLTYCGTRSRIAGPGR